MKHTATIILLLPSQAKHGHKLHMVAAQIVPKRIKSGLNDHFNRAPWCVFRKRSKENSVGYNSIVARQALSTTKQHIRVIKDQATLFATSKRLDESCVN